MYGGIDAGLCQTGYLTRGCSTLFHDSAFHCGFHMEDYHPLPMWFPLWKFARSIVVESGLATATQGGFSSAIWLNPLHS
jgi:hypothetical protein